MHATRTAEERTREINPRPIVFEFPRDTPRYWMGGDPFQTTLFNALSLTFPDGERFFVASVRAMRDHVQDPHLERQVRGFMAQEALHRREHASLNRWLESQGVPVATFYSEVARILSRPERRAPPEVQLAVTCALEHFTAILAELWLTTPELREQAAPGIRQLWTWHALEELDHKAVAFDVYRAAEGSYLTRVVVMSSTTVVFLAKVAQMHVRLMAREKQLLNLRSWLNGARRLWGPRGHFIRLVPAYLRYYRPSFHPWDQDDRPLVARFSRELGFTSSGVAYEQLLSDIDSDTAPAERYLATSG